MVFEFITSMHPLLFNSIVMFLSLLIVVKAADLLIFGITNYAKKFGISDYLIGFVVLALGTSLPELVSSIMGSLAGSSGVVVGTVLGSGVITITFVLGTMTVVAKKLDVSTKLLGKSKYIILGMVCLPLILVSDGALTRADGIILIGVFMIYIAGLWNKEGTLGRLKKNVKLKHLWKDMAIFLGALVALLLGAKWLVFSSVIISQELGVSAYFIALLVVGLGASIPDLTVELKSLKKGHAAIGFGNVLGGITAEMLLILGLIALVFPFNISGIGLPGLISTIVFFIGGLGIVLFWVRKNVLHRWQGFVLLGWYVLFVVVQIVIEIFM